MTTRRLGSSLVADISSRLAAQSRKQFDLPVQHVVRAEFELLRLPPIHGTSASTAPRLYKITALEFWSELQVVKRFLLWSADEVTYGRSNLASTPYFLRPL